MNILISADKFKDCLSAETACNTIAEEILRLHPRATLSLCPLTDGGEGFAEVLTSAANGLLPGEEICDPLRRTTQASFGIVLLENICPEARARLCLPAGLREDSRIAIVEMAAASGLQLLQPAERDPWQTDSFGTGQLLLAAQAAEAELILLGVGGSATNDLGLGALHALGCRFIDESGQPLPRPCPANWHRITRIEGKLPDDFPPLRIACDVTNPLLGKQGAAAVFAPQKGLQAKDLPRLEAQMERIAHLLCAHHGHAFAERTTQPGSGAAGGIAFGLMCAASTGQQENHAMLVAGFDLVADWLQLHQKLEQADIVITGEGRFDASSLKGKGPGALASAALTLGKPVHIFAGSAECPPQPNLHLYSITPAAMPLAEALAQAPQLLRQAVAKAFGVEHW